MTSEGPTPPGWRTYALSEIVEIFDGPHATPTKTTDGPIFLGISALSRGRLLKQEYAHLSEADFVKWTKRVTPQPRDLVFSYETRLGEAALIPSDLRCCLGRRMGLLRIKTPEVDPRYLLYAYLGPQFQAVIRDRTIHGSTVDRISIKELGSFPMLLPTLPEQHKIAQVLGAIDDKIESNSRLIELLRQCITLLFRHHVVDGRQADWPICGLTSIARFVNGRAFTKDANGSGRPILRIKELNTGLSGATLYSDIQGADENIARRGDLLFAWSGSLDAYRWHGPESLINQHIFKVLREPQYPTWFVAEWLQVHMPEFQRIAADKATTMGHIKREHLGLVDVAVPPPADLDRLDGCIQPLDAKITTLYSENDTLWALRETLLPALVSGRLSISDSEVDLAGPEQLGAQILVA